MISENVDKIIFLVAMAGLLLVVIILFSGGGE